MARVTSSRDRSKRTASKRPTSSATRPQRSRASTNSSRTTQSGGGQFGSARVTRDARRPVNTGARVTGGPAPTRPALPAGGKGGALAVSPSSALATTTNRPNPRGPRPGGRVVVDESPRLPAGRGGALAARPSSALVAPAKPNTTVNVRGGGVRTGQPGPNRLALPAGRPAPTAASAAKPAAGLLGKAGSMAGGLLGGAGMGLAIANQANTVAQGFRNVNKPYVSLANKRNQGANEGAARWNQSVANRGGPSKPPQAASKPPGGTSTPSAPQRPAAAAPSGPSAPSRSSTAPAAAPSKPPSAATAPRKSPAEMAATDSWSINFLRAKRNQPSLSSQPQRLEDTPGYREAAARINERNRRKK